MSGSGMMMGGAYQAGVIAWLYVHMLREQRLHWFELADDRPLAVAGEVSGPGDDVRIDFPPGVPSVEIQAKHGLSGRQRLREALSRIGRTPSTTPSAVVLVVDRTSSRWIHRILPDDLECLRQDRPDAVRKETCQFLESLPPSEAEALGRLYVKVLDVDELEDPDSKWAVSALQDLLKDPTGAEVAWKLLRDDATTVCKRRLNRTASDLQQLLGANGLEIRPAPPLQRLDHELDASKVLLKQHKPLPVLSLLSEIEQQFADCSPDAVRLHRFFQHRSTAYMQLGRLNDAFEAAETALQYDPDGLYALLTAGESAIGLGKLDAARQYADRAVLKHPNEPNAWLLKADLASAKGDDPSSAPASIRASTQYRAGICRILLRDGRVHDVLDATESLIKDGTRTPEVLVVRARAMITNAWGDVGVYEPAVAEEAAALASEVVAADPDDATLRDAYLVRSVAWRSLGRDVDADADLRSANELQPDDPAAITEGAQSDLNAGRYDAAYRTLSTPLAERYPILLALRAAALASLSRTKLAADDIDLALKRLPKAWDPNAVRLACADAALRMDDEGRVEQALTGLSDTAKDSSRYAIVRGRMAFMRGDTGCGKKWLARAAERDAKMRPGILTELACRLLAAGQAEEAVAAFDTVEDVPRKALRMYCDALLRAGRFADADTLVRRTLSDDEAPDWALEAAVRIAILRDDLESGVKYLKVLRERPGVTNEARLELLRLLIRLRRQDEAEELVDGLIAKVDELDGRQHMTLAQVVHFLGNAQMGLQLAFTAYRKEDDDPELHRALAALALQSPLPETTTSIVGPDCYVRLASVDENRTVDYTVLSVPPVRARDRQILVEPAERLGLIGLRVGETLTLEESWGSGRWRVEEIKPAVQHVVQVYRTRFLGHKFVLRSVA